MFNLKQDINGAINIIEGKDYSYNQLYSKHSKIYPFTNEDLVHCFANFDFNNKKCLTVLGSSDQILDMYLRGASEITTFDINILTKYFFYLKKAAILSNLTKDEYLDFLYPTYNKNKKYYYNTFSKIAKNLSRTNLTFWSKLFDTYIEKLYDLFSNDINTRNSIEKSINYLSNNNYYELKEKLKDMDIKFINSDIKNLPNKLTGMYDIIYLSNIMEYAEYIYNKEKPNSLEEYKKLVLKLANNLNEYGRIIICYFFYTTEFSKKVFTENGFSFKDIGEPAILQYTKKLLKSSFYFTNIPLSHLFPQESITSFPFFTTITSQLFGHPLHSLLLVVNLILAILKSKSISSSFFDSNATPKAPIKCPFGST